MRAHSLRFLIFNNTIKEKVMNKAGNTLSKALITALSIVLLTCTKAAAFNISPLLVELDAKPGVTYSGSLMLAGNESRKESVRVYFEDWDKTPDGEDNSLMPGSIDRSCAGWMSVSPSQADIPAGGSIELKFTIAVPENAKGSYWTFIMAEENKKPDAPKQNSDDMQFMIQSVFRFAVRILVNISDGAETKGEITDLKIFKPETQDKLKHYNFAGRISFKNTGNYLLKPQGYMEIRDSDGETLTRSEIQPKSYVIPGRERYLEVPLETKLPAGDYIAIAALDYGGNEIVAGETPFTVSPDGAVLTQ